MNNELNKLKLLFNLTRNDSKDRWEFNPITDDKKKHGYVVDFSEANNESIAWDVFLQEYKLIVNTQKSIQNSAIVKNDFKKEHDSVILWFRHAEHKIHLAKDGCLKVWVKYRKENENNSGAGLNIESQGETHNYENTDELIDSIGEITCKLIKANKIPVLKEYNLSGVHEIEYTQAESNWLFNILLLTKGMGDRPSWRFYLRNMILRQIETNVYEIELRCNGHHPGGSYVSSEEATNSYLKILKKLFAPLVFTNTGYDSHRDIYTFKTTVKENEINEFANSLVMVHNN